MLSNDLPHHLSGILTTIYKEDYPLTPVKPKDTDDAPFKQSISGNKK